MHFYDCVGFVSEALKQSSPAAYAQVATAAGVDAHHVPKPAGYQQFFATLGTSTTAGWQQVPTAAGIQPGDIVAVPYPPGHSSDGHIVIAAGAPQAVGNNLSESPPVTGLEKRTSLKRSPRSGFISQEWL